MTLTIDPFVLPLDRPLETAAGRVDERTGFLVTVEVDGERGLGEATPLPGWTESRRACHAALKGIDDPVAALDADDRTDTDGLVAAPAARHGLSLAVADARARATDRPLYRHLGGDRRIESVPVNAMIGDGPPQETAQAAVQAVEEGFAAVKVKVGARPLEVDCRRLQAIRERVPAVELRVDANGGWTMETARDALEAFASLDVAYVEQPLPAGDLEGHAALRGGSVSVALDEGLVEHDIQAIVAADAADVLIVKPMVVGGPARARRLVLQAREAGLEGVLTTTVDGAVARAGAVHVAASLPDMRACGLATGERLAVDLLADPAPTEDGAVRVPQGPGNVGS